MQEQSHGGTHAEATREGEVKPIAQLTIDMARHSVKGDKPREALTEEGMGKAVASRVQETPTHLGQIFGSPRERTGQSSVLRKFAKYFKDVNFENTDPEDVVRWLESGGLKKTETPLLNFQLGEGDYNTEIMDAFKKGEYFKWTVENSDRRALETRQKQDKVTPLSVQAGNIAVFIVREIYDLYDRKANKGEATESRGIDFATAHMGVIESFLYKVMEVKSESPEVMRKFLEKNKQGFQENEGIKVEVKIYNPDHHDTAWEVEVRYGDKLYVLKPQDLQQIVFKGEILRQTLAEQQESA